jgi:hypothetical protein
MKAYGSKMIIDTFLVQLVFENYQTKLSTTELYSYEKIHSKIQLKTTTIEILAKTPILKITNTIY